MNTSPNKLHNTTKPLIDLKVINAVGGNVGGKRRKNSQPLIKRREGCKVSEGNMCVNHPGKEGYYRAYIEDEMMYYCTKCSMQLASQGFAVERVSEEAERYHY